MEWLKEGCLQKVFYTQRNDSIGSAIKFLTLADHYAQQQGAYAYQKFQVQIRELKAALKHSLESLKKELNSHLSIDWDLDASLFFSTDTKGNAGKAHGIASK
jgi:hypothetical protein